MRSNRAARRSILAALVIAGLLLAGCGGDDDDGDDGAAASGDTSTTTTAEATGDAVDLTEIEAMVDELINGELDFPRPEEPVDPGEHEVAVVASGLSSTGPARVADEIQKALKVIGWTAKPTYDGKFQPTEQAALIQAAVNDGVDAIFMISITPSAVSSAVTAAQQADIPLICILCGPDPITEGIVNVQADAVAAGHAHAAYAIAKSVGRGTMVVYHNDEFEFSSQQMDAAEAFLEENCPECEIDSRSLLLAEAREPNAPVWTQLLDDYPEGELAFVLSPFDSPAGALATTAQQLGRTDFGIIGYGALSPFVDMVGTGSPEVAKTSVTISTPYFGWAAVDQAARVLAGVPTWDSDAMPVGLITKDNYDRFPAGEPYEAPEFDFEEFFSEIWGK